jgi:hypothetical protein
MTSKVHLHGKHPCPMHFVKRKKLKKKIQTKPLMLSKRQQKLVEEKKIGSKPQGDQGMHSQSWTTNPTKAN